MISDSKGYPFTLPTTFRAKSYLNLALLKSSSKSHQLCKVHSLPLTVCISHFLLAVDDAEQDSGTSPPGPPGNLEETSDGHTNTPPVVEDDTGGDRSLRLDDANSTNEQSMRPIIEEQTSIPNPIDAAIHDELKGNDTDLLSRIRGLYRLLDLINEQGSGEAGMISAPEYHITGTQPTVIHKWTKSSSLMTLWQSL